MYNVELHQEAEDKSFHVLALCIRALDYSRYNFLKKSFYFHDI